MFKDLKVIEFATVLAGPAVGAFFAELGAQVIKVESPSGDVTRHWRLPSEKVDSDITAYFSSVNWGKKSVVLDLKSTSGQEKAKLLCQDADIVLVNFKPGSAQKLNLDYESLKAIKPDLIYATLSGYGSNENRAGYDAIIQAESGFMYLNGEMGGKSLKMPVALMDLLAAHQLKEAILLALLKKAYTQKGSLIQVSLLDSALVSLANQASNWLVAKQSPQKMGSEHPNIVPYGQVVRSHDQEDILLAVGSDLQFKKLCEIINMPDLAKDSRFETNAQRVIHREILRPHLEKAISNFMSPFLLDALNQAKIPAGLIHDIPQALSSPQAQSLLHQMGSLQGLRTIAFQIDGWKPISLSAPPHLGEHNTDILG